MKQPKKSHLKTRSAIIAYLATLFAGLTTLIYTPGGLHLPQMTNGISLASAYVLVMSFAFIFIVSSPAFLLTTISLFITASVASKKDLALNGTRKIMTKVWAIVLVASLLVWNLFRYRSPNASFWGNLLMDLHVAAICGVSFCTFLAVLFLLNRGSIDNHYQ